MAALIYYSNSKLTRVDNVEPGFGDSVRLDHSSKQCNLCWQGNVGRLRQSRPRETVPKSVVPGRRFNRNAELAGDSGCRPITYGDNPGCGKRHIGGSAAYYHEERRKAHVE